MCADLCLVVTDIAALAVILRAFVTGVTGRAELRTVVADDLAFKAQHSTFVARSAILAVPRRCAFRALLTFCADLSAAALAAAAVLLVGAHL